MADSGANLIVALDFDTAEAAIELARQLDPSSVRLKVGKQLFTIAGPDVVRALHDLGFDIFLDLKFHDIPNTVAGAVGAAADLGVWMVNVHALGGRIMMMAASDVLANKDHRPLLIAVTILTSMGTEDIAEIGLSGEPADNVARLAALTEESGLDGVVCSP